MNNPVELVVVGSGPAGIEAAVAAANAGVEVVLIDSVSLPGGQYFKQLPVDFRSEDHTGLQTKAKKLLQKLASSKVQVIADTLVWGAFLGDRPGEWCLALYGPDVPARLHTRALILATGAYDRSIAFPGWDLPGVMTAGAVSILVKNQRVLPGRRFILSGSGPLQLSTAAQLVQAGAEVVGVLESAPRLFSRGLSFLPAAWGQWGRIGEGFDYMGTLVGAGVPYRPGWAVIEGRGEERVTEAVIARLDGDGKPLPGSEKIVPVDTIVVGYGLVPNTDLSRVLDCDHEYAAERGGFVPRRGADMQTSLPGVYAVGDGAGIGGAELAMIEGRIAGWSAALKLGHVTESQAGEAIAREKPALDRQQRFAGMLGSLFAPPPGLYSLAKEDTIICRCEQVTLGQIREAVKFGTQTVIDVKNLTRCGMGNCQGRTCGEMVARILAAETGRSLEEVRHYAIRPPIHPLPLDVLEEADSAKV